MCTHVYAGFVEIGTRELRANLAAALRRVAAGERLVITVDGRPVAQLGPVEPAGAPTLADLAASGLVDPPRRTRPAAPPDPDDTAVDVRLDRVLAEVRGE
jgi:prevent-host-death family protein